MHISASQLFGSMLGLVYIIIVMKKVEYFKIQTTI